MFNDPQGPEELVEAFLLGFPALFSIINPIGGAFTFHAMMGRSGAAERGGTAGRVALYSLLIVLAALWAGSFIMTFFGITLAALRCAGGVVIAMNAWTMLSAPTQAGSPEPLAARGDTEIAFYPLTMPITAGPGTISVAVALSAEHPRLLGSFGWFFAGMTLAALAVSLIIWVTYGSAHRVTRFLGEGGNRVFTRLTAFMLMCIGFQVLITGIQDVVASFLHPVE